MKRRTVANVVLAMMCTIGLLGCTPTQLDRQPQEPSSFEAAQLLARRDEARPESLEWRRRALAGLGDALSVTDPCTRGIAFADIPTVTAVVKLSTQGRVTKVFALQRSTFAECFGERLKLMDLGSAPWDGYWYEIRMVGPSEAAQRPPQVISFSGEACMPRAEAQLGDQLLQISDITPPSGSTIGQDERLSFSLTYSVPTASADQYKLMAIFHTSTPGRAVGMGRVDFPFPATCGTKGSIKAHMPVSHFWSMSDLSNPMRFRLTLVNASDMNVVAQSELVEYSKP